MERGKRNHVLLIVLLLVIIGIYIYPFIATWMAIGIVNLPPLFAPDLYRYLNLACLKLIRPGFVENPWFGDIAPITDAIIYNIFGLPLKLFHILSYILGGSLVLTIFIWNIIWTIMIFLSFFWLLNTIKLRQNMNIIFLGLSILLLSDLTSLQSAFCVGLVCPHWMVYRI